MDEPVRPARRHLLGYHPALTQMSFRIGDSVTNVVTPMMSYFGLILAFGMRYDKKLGIGTLVSIMLPYSIFFLIGWVLLFLALSIKAFFFNSVGLAERHAK